MSGDESNNKWTQSKNRNNTYSNKINQIELINENEVNFIVTAM